jgi:hypothetical protein
VSRRLNNAQNRHDRVAPVVKFRVGSARRLDD